MNCILIDSKENEDVIGVIENDNLVELYIEEDEGEKILGNIYRGKVVNVLPGMEAAFIDIGVGKNAYLYVKDALPKEERFKDSTISIKNVVKEGEEIIVQVIKESFNNKGPKVTTHISLAGRYLVLMPFSSNVSVSRKIRDEKEVKRLLNIGQEIQEDSMGLILRTASIKACKKEIEKDFKILSNIYRKIERERNFISDPKLLYKDMDLSYQIIRDSDLEEIDKIIINNEEKYEDIKMLFQFKFPQYIEKIVFKDFNIYTWGNIKYEIETILSGKIPLKSGGYIVIDETEALTAIDINTGRYVGKYSLEDTILRTNLEAAEEIARQLRLQNIGGIIIIDFIDMREKEDISLVLEELEKHIRKDRTKVNIVDMTKLGLVELTRKKVRNSLSSKLLDTCKYCNGKGKVLIKKD